jgi:hypothetical protein
MLSALTESPGWLSQGETAWQHASVGAGQFI